MTIMSWRNERVTVSNDSGAIGFPCLHDNKTKVKKKLLEDRINLIETTSIHVITNRKLTRYKGRRFSNSSIAEEEGKKKDSRIQIIYLVPHL